MRNAELIEQLNEELARLEAQREMLVEKFRASQRARGVPEDELLTTAKLEEIGNRVMREIYSE